jgi:hypothetical protein
LATLISAGGSTEPNRDKDIAENKIPVPMIAKNATPTELVDLLNRVSNECAIIRL